MNFSLHDLKESMYILETLFGIFLLVLAYFALERALASPDVLFYLIPGLALLLVGGFLVLFGVETVILRDDPDIWD